MCIVVDVQHDQTVYHLQENIAGKTAISFRYLVMFER